MGHGFTSEGKSQGVHSVQQCAKYMQGSVALIPYHRSQKIKEAASLKAKVHCTAASWSCVHPLEVGRLGYELTTLVVL